VKNTTKTLIGILVAVMVLSTIVTPLQALSLNVKTEYTGSTIEKPLIHEATRIIAGKGTAAVISHAYFGGNVTFNVIDTGDAAFSDLWKLVVIMEKGAWDPEYWPYPLWPWPEGLTIIVQYRGITIDEALSRGQIVVDMVKQELNIEEDVSLFHFQGKGDILTLVYILHTINYDAMVDKWVELLPVNIDDTLINVDNIKESNLTSVVFSILEDIREGGFITWMATIYINQNAITIEDEEYTLSVNSAVGHEGPIYPVPDVRHSELFIRVPYVGNVTYFDPPPDNLFPDMTGRFKYILKPEEWPVNNTGAEDIIIRYNFNYSTEWAFPVLRATFYTEPYNPVIDIINGSEIIFWVEIENVGDKTARDIMIRMPVDYNLLTGVPIVGKEIFKHLDAWLNQISWTIYLNDTWQEWNWTIEDWVEGFWVNATATLLDTIWINGTPIPLNMTEDVEEEILEVEEDEERKCIGTWNIFIDKLEPNETVKVGYTVKIDSIEEALNRTEMTIDIPDEYEGAQVNSSSGHLLSLDEDSLKDFIANFAREAASNIQNFLNTIADVDPAAFHFGMPFGPMVIFHDNVGHEYFVMANGYITQFNDDEPVIIPVVTLDDYSLLIGQTTNVTCTIYNRGDVAATDVSVEFIHAIVGYNWTLIDQRVFHREYIGAIEANSSVTSEWVDVPRTFVGLHPVLAKVYYKDEAELEHEVFSNVIFALLFPKKVPEPDYPYPYPEVEITKVFEIENLNETTVGDIITVKVNIKNTGTEDTGIKIYEAFNSSALALEKMDEYHYIKVYKTLPNGTQIDITDQITYRVHFNRTVDNFRVTVIVLLAKRGMGIRLGVNETITLVYKVRLANAGLVLIYPTKVEYTTRFPIEHRMEAEEEEGGGGGPALKLAVKQEGVEAENVWAAYSISLTAYVSAAAQAVPRITKIAIIGILTIIALATVVVWRNRKKPIEEVEPLLMKTTKNVAYIIF